MRIPRIYHPATLTPGMVTELTDDGTNHVARVLRMKTGYSLILFNGTNRIFNAEITDISKKSVSVRVTDEQDDNRESPLFIHLGQVMSRGEKMEFTIQKSVELGVQIITP